MHVFVELLQWPAMIVTVIAAWLMASSSKNRRNVGFWCFLASNGLWFAWGWSAHAYALIVLQLCLAIINIRAVLKTEPQSEPTEARRAAG